MTVSLLAGAIALFLGYQLSRRYREPFMNSYFYYLVFLYIFGAYSLIGTNFLERIFTSMEVEETIILSVKSFNFLVGIPLLVIAKYMLVRSMADLFTIKIHVAFSAIYLILSAMLMAMFGTGLIRLNYFGQGDFNVLAAYQKWGFAGFMLASYLVVLFITLYYSRRSPGYLRSFSRFLGLGYFIYMILSMTIFLLSELHPSVQAVFHVVFLSWHLIPILFLSLYLEKHHGKQSRVALEFGEMLQRFQSRYDISKREEEVIRLICQGLSNKEISDTLYISLQTVKDHVHRIYVKTGVRNRVQLTNLIRNG
jgi:DNA-binding CsgD family transcriptional regulator